MTVLAIAMLLWIRVALVAFAGDVLSDRLLASQRHPLTPTGFNPTRGDARFLSQQEILLDH
jgi:hypothetical protein